MWKDAEMDPTDIGLFHLAERRLEWVDARQKLLAQNVANANTPGFKARDVAPFVSVLSASTMTGTSPLHMSGKGASGTSIQIHAADRSPDGNAVSMEEQLTRVADTAGVQELVLNLHHRYQAMMRLALGRGG